MQKHFLNLNSINDLQKTSTERPRNHVKGRLSRKFYSFFFKMNKIIRDLLQELVETRIDKGFLKCKPLFSEYDCRFINRVQVLAFLTFILAIQVHAQSLEVKSPNGSEKLLGIWSYERLRSTPYAEWFIENYNEYEPNVAHIKQLKSKQNSFDSVTLFMGTWCGDSKREVPRFIKSVEELGFDMSKLKLICVDRTFQNYKQSPGREESDLNIHRVPTFIFHRNGTEIGRIVESPRESLEQDMLKIVDGKEYIPNYEGIVLLNQLLTDNGLDYLQQNKLDIVRQLDGVVKNKYELNTYGLVLFSSFQLAEANMIYELNKLLFPDEPLPYFSLGRFEAISGNLELAKANLEHALKLAPDDKNIQVYLDELR